MRLYTVCINQTPITVISAGVEPALPNELATNTEILKALRHTQIVQDMTPDDARRGGELTEIDEAVDTWLGADLNTFTHAGVALWNGDPSCLHIREALPEEAETWRASFNRALATGEQDAGDESWGVYLVKIDADEHA